MHVNLFFDGLSDNIRDIVQTTQLKFRCITEKLDSKKFLSSVD